MRIQENEFILQTLSDAASSIFHWSLQKMCLCVFGFKSNTNPIRLFLGGILFCIFFPLVFNRIVCLPVCLHVPNCLSDVYQPIIHLSVFVSNLNLYQVYVNWLNLYSDVFQSKIICAIDSGKGHIFITIMFPITAGIELVARITEASMVQEVRWHIGATCIKCLCHYYSVFKQRILLITWHNCMDRPLYMVTIPKEVRKESLPWRNCSYWIKQHVYKHITWVWVVFTPKELLKLL